MSTDDCFSFQRRADELAAQQENKTLAQHIDDIEAESRKVEADFVRRMMATRNASLVLDVDHRRWLVRFPEGGELSFDVDSPDGKLLELIAEAA